MGIFIGSSRTKCDGPEPHSMLGVVNLDNDCDEVLCNQAFNAANTLYYSTCLAPRSNIQLCLFNVPVIIPCIILFVSHRINIQLWLFNVHVVIVAVECARYKFQNQLSYTHTNYVPVIIELDSSIGVYLFIFYGLIFLVFLICYLCNISS